MNEIDDPPVPLRALAPVPHTTRSGRRILLTLAILAVLGTLLYLLRVPARQQFDRLRAVAPVASVVPAAPADDGRVAALETEVGQLRQRVGTLEQLVTTLSTAPARPAVPLATAVPVPSLTTGTDPLVMALSARMDRLDAQITDQGGQLKTDESQLQAAANQADAVSALTDRTTRLARVQAAEAALQAGLPLGQLPGAPAALARFSTEPPPTEAQLRLAFPEVARAARAASRPDTAQLGFWRAMRARAEALITVRRGDTVLVGSAQIGLIDRARAALEAGDLGGAVSILGGLDGPAAAAVADWRGRAQALLDAQIALARFASQS
jgi:hypothetical protein